MINISRTTIVIWISAGLAAAGMVWLLRHPYYMGPEFPERLLVWPRPVRSPEFLVPPAPLQSPIVPTPMSPSSSPEPSQPVDTRTWGERFRNPAIPEVPGIAWQTYRNTEYSFVMEYPVGWEVATNKSDSGRSISINFSTSPDFYFDTFSYVAIHKKRLSEFVKQDLDQNSYLARRFMARTIIPDTTINGLEIFIDRPDLEPQSMPLWIIFERDGHTFVINQHEPGFDYQRNSQITEHMVKTFRFLK